MGGMYSVLYPGRTFTIRELDSSLALEMFIVLFFFCPGMYGVCTEYSRTLVSTPEIPGDYVSAGPLTGSVCALFILPVLSY